MVIIKNQWYLITDIESLRLFYKDDEASKLSGYVGRSLDKGVMELSEIYCNKGRGYGGAKKHVSIPKTLIHFKAPGQSLKDLYE